MIRYEQPPKPQSNQPNYQTDSRWPKTTHIWLMSPHHIIHGFLSCVMRYQVCPSHMDTTIMMMMCCEWLWSYETRTVNEILKFHTIIVSRICHYELFNSLKQTRFSCIIEIPLKTIPTTFIHHITYLEEEGTSRPSVIHPVSQHRKKRKTLQAYNQVFHEPK